MTMPQIDAEIEARLLSFTSLRSVSMPVISRISSTPNCEMASSIAFCSLAAGNSACCTIGKQRAEQRRAEHEAGHQHAHHRRLLQPQQHLAEQPADQHQHDKLDDEDRFGRPVAAPAAGGGPLPRSAAQATCRRRRAEPGRHESGGGCAQFVGMSTPRPRSAMLRYLRTRRSFERQQPSEAGLVPREMQLQIIRNKARVVSWKPC